MLRHAAHQLSVVARVGLVASVLGVIAGPAVIGATSLGQLPTAREMVQQAQESNDRVIAEFRRGAITPETPGLTKPVVTRSSHPAYTSEAMRARIEGQVVVEVIVSSNGTVERVRLVKGLEPGLDQQALGAARTWQFEPARLDGKAVAVWCEVSMQFRLH